MVEIFPTKLCWLQGYETHYYMLGRAFWDWAKHSGMFRGRSEVKERIMLGQ